MHKYGIWFYLYRPKLTQTHIALGITPHDSVGSASLKLLAIA